MYRPLAPCPSCHRHVRASEGACPFCAASLGAAVPVAGSAGRMARGALFVFAASVAASVAGCGGSTTDDPAPADTGRVDDGGSLDAMYGAPADTSVTDTGAAGTLYGAPADTGIVDDTGSPMPKYGAPPIPDAAAD